MGQIVVQALTGLTHLATDTFNSDNSGNRIYRAHRDITTVLTHFIYPDSSNRVTVETDSTPGGVKGTKHFGYDSLGARRRMYVLTTGPTDSFDLQVYQYDAAGRMMGSAIGTQARPQGYIVSDNDCAYDADAQSVQPCGAGALTVLGGQTIHDPNGNWFYVYAPGVDQPLLAVRRNPVDTSLLARLDLVTDGAGRLIALADSSGQLNSAYAQAIPGSNGGPWGSGITRSSQTFDPRRWATAIGGDTISTFRNRQYDPAAGRWMQEDPEGTAGGINLYQYNGNDPNSFSDPFGLCPPADRNVGDCPESDLGNAWRILNGSKPGRSVIADYVHAKPSVDTSLSTCEGSAKACTDHDRRSVHVSGNAPAKAVRLAHEIVHVEGHRSKGTADYIFKEEIPAWKRALNVFRALTPENKSASGYTGAADLWSHNPENAINQIICQDFLPKPRACNQ